MSDNQVPLWVRCVAAAERSQTNEEHDVLMEAARELKRFQKVEDNAIADYMEMLSNETVPDSTDGRMLVRAAERLREIGD